MTLASQAPRLTLTPTREVLFDGRDDSGRSLALGLQLVVVTVGGARAITRLVIRRQFFSRP